MIKRIPRAKLSLLRPEVSDIDRDEQRIKFEEANKLSRKLDPGCKVSVWNPRQDSRGRWLVRTVEQQLGPNNYLVNVEGHFRYVHIDQMRWRDQQSVPETADVSVPEIEVEEIPVPVIPVKETGQVVEIQSTEHKDQGEETTLISKEMLSPPEYHEIETPRRYPKRQNRQPPARYREQ